MPRTLSPLCLENKEYHRADSAGGRKGTFLQKVSLDPSKPLKKVLKTVFTEKD